ncbi:MULTISPECIES: ABC transporter permease [unclassified Modicisalibacter]|uniref:ABC transporter permease n=1 Tax=unclassified Modicisalibacter TaxID=2679913 RepID=UPI001CCA2D11|nr:MULTISPECIES: ABC transporter permease [unclassified Modicisalibacter]MBZ9556458.1 ABC transporter permease [Modicisalibacter sp. R2A 31.J]MBZ9575073.1 ABC transporter permease [Modicisalibacter sp. MOD 31.J]
MEAFITSWLGSTPAFAIPLALASMGLVLCERAGILNMAAEGYMALGAMTAAVLTLTLGNPTIGIVCAVLAGAALALLFGVAVVILRCEQILAGLATMAVGLGIAGVVGRPYVHKSFDGLQPLHLPPLDRIPVIGRLLFDQDVLVYLTVLIGVALWWLLEKTRAGLKIRAVGEDPASADVAGVKVQVQQLLAITASGALCGLGGAYLSVASSSIWVENMVAGRGWIALALVVFARWDPLKALAGAFLFGAIEALLPRLQAIGVPAPIYLMNMLPYLFTIAVLLVAAVSGAKKGVEPAALGKPYVRQDRH